MPCELCLFLIPAVVFALWVRAWGRLKAFRPHLLVIGDTRVYREVGFCRTTLPNGRTVDARPQDTPEYEERARALGYASGEECNREHDALHSLVAYWLGEKACPVLTAVSEGREWEHAGAREELVLDLQKAMHRDFRSPALLWLELQTGRDTDDLVTEARRVLRGE